MASQSSKKALETHLQKYLRNSGQEYELLLILGKPIAKNWSISPESHLCCVTLGAGGRTPVPVLPKDGNVRLSHGKERAG